MHSDREKLVKHMVDRFLIWKLPKDFNPDGGISFKPVVNMGTEQQYYREPVGTNLFDAQQAEAMVRYMLDGAPALSEPVKDEPAAWHRSTDGAGAILLYTLRQDGWRRGEPVMVNDAMVRVEAANGSQTPIEPIAERILSALTRPAGERPAVAVEALEWDQHDPRRDVWFAETPFGDYFVGNEASDVFRWKFSPSWPWSEDFYATADAAKAAAQADYERRIRSALTAEPQAVPEGIPARESATDGWVPLTRNDGKMNCRWPADETVVEVMLRDGRVCRAWHSCNILDAGDWDFVPVDANDEPDDAADSLGSNVVAWRAAMLAASPAVQGGE